MNKLPLLVAALAAVLGTALRADTPTTGTPLATQAGGRILCQYWRELPGSDVADLVASPAYPAFPHEQAYLDRFEIPENQENDFGTVIGGWVHPPQSGQYTFFIAGDNQAELWLSSDDTPAHVSKIASVPEWSMPKAYTANPQQQSAAIRLEAGRRYYVEARHKDGGGDNSLSVAWKLPDGAMEGPIPGSRLSPAQLVDVPGPKLLIPPVAGTSRITVEVDYLTRKFTVPVQVTLPDNYRADGQYPLLVFLHDTDPVEAVDDAATQPTTQDSRISPDRAFAAHPELRKAYPFIIISPQCPADGRWEQRVVVSALAAIVRDLASRLPVDPQQRYLTGAGSGGTEVWRLAAEMPHWYAAVMPICGLQVARPDLPEKLQGTRILIATGSQNGFATECANRMGEALQNNQPKPEMSYEADKGSEAADFAYAQPSYWNWLLNRPKAQPKVEPVVVKRRWPPYVAAGVAALLVAGVAVHRLRRRPTYAGRGPA